MDLVSLLASDSYIIYNKEFASKYGVEEAILLGAMCSYQKSFNNEEFFREEEKISQDTGLTIYAIRKAKQTLKNLGILEISKKGLPSRHYFKVIPERLLNPIYSSDENITSSSDEIVTTVSNENVTTANNDFDTTNYNNNYNRKDNITTINSSYTETVNHRSDDTVISSKNSSPKSLNNFSENIIENAARYVHHEIKIILKDQYLEIFNDGEPIDNSNPESLFQPYEIGHKGQFGLGLSIVYKTVTMYGYKVEAVNRVDGVSFIIQNKD